MLICPKCKKEHCYRCPEGHSFDIARQGYVNLSLKQKKNQGDNRLMVLARSKFLEEEHYDFMRQFVKDKLVDHNIHTLIDGGCGQGYYTKEFKQVVDTVYGILLLVSLICHFWITQLIVSLLFLHHYHMKKFIVC